MASFEGMSPGIKRILVVEDDDGISEVIQLALLQETVYNPILVTNSYEALKTANKEKPDLFIIDYRLSDMNGIDLYDKLHAFEQLKDVPTIITSASIEQYEQELVRRNLVGIGKPFELDDLLNTIKRLVD